MLKRVVIVNLIFITLFYFSPILALDEYKYVDENNKYKVEELIDEVYDVKQQYIDIFGELEDDDDVSINSSYNDQYWWPVGSVETKEVNGRLFAIGNPEAVIVSSDFGVRIDPATGAQKVHRGTDITGGRNGLTNIIASKSGVVVYPESLEGNNVGDGIYSAGYGNYVIIQHSDGNYTLYGHLAANSITVKSGDYVEQGQVIAKMGSSGYSTGTHLHFEIRIGENSNSAAVKTVGTYIFTDNPRPSSSSSELINFIDIFEGGAATLNSNNEYVIVCIGDGAHTVGNGVTFEFNNDKFIKYGIDTSKYSCNGRDSLPKDVVDKIRAEIIDDTRSSVETHLAQNGISLKDYQIDALTSLKYQRGNIGGFVENYRKYGETQALYDNWWSWVGTSSKFPGTFKRRKAEWELFTTGVYNAHY